MTGTAPRGSAPRIVVAGGHSAGHIEPAMNLADAVRRVVPSARITALGTVRGLDTRLIPERGYPLELIPPAPMPRTLGPGLWTAPARLCAAVRAAGAVLDRVGAEIVVGFGGYVALPAYLAARPRRLPIVVHEANARAGWANRIGAGLTDNVFTAGPDVRLIHARAVGIPLRATVAALDRTALRRDARRHFGLSPDAPVLLATGGSQGAETINAAVSGAAAALRSAGIQVLHVTGPGRTVRLPEGDSAYVSVPYLDEMRWGYAAADFAICRSGAMTCAELAAVGLPSAYVPLPLRGAEQRLNAAPVVAAGGGILIDDADLSPEKIVTDLIPLLTAPARIAMMSARAATAGAADAGEVLAEEVLRTVAARRAGAPRRAGRRRHRA
ncbi:UDP-N-acetylglucosamine--N-acetylmuramyl-(pentapeptide) pyrophosphoryl-undecaprenol N-acetylglucosamine transferase [Tsukamurella sp. 8F]|uniref:UDP-N-acetylglucosamine--N-acetylmuramyl- (pentapeptide) pyrophosphoryl-undecaprenol N-acetylglucosamine transferase n=1 Tax=unclassified Tsukamurella TaxID=2633480 RepID=UPI0023B930F7|nr:MULTISPECIES: UDP-N-acetylglucosamine--N-acetylmuramyl-(pentapeptide) pyrophosphoryl-undecaprenol N-acetylglucosamine transferase [unclassified Tsukamurella]MDF0530950.1 UDP-N-acetylglucosamine--N-acetylmuramyl-(pentapeptide) pyrophosphoryl-undecaprenol N-acetylglucosamine transferase [Tsukamurella sp. 8J]MDF0588275.1 UDP-N-acetylglucosamine--N-acetylmuramyl-(pentapeptide) pyrophosphoryl-undecaprenol N-acetylglucosamine transferase [Tsukamurella sp. 8F]